VKFFTYKLIAAANGWGRETLEEQRTAIDLFERAVKTYHRHLDRRRPKVPAAAWRFFRHRDPENTLHDARLINMTIGDIPMRLGSSSKGRRPFTTRVRLEFLTHAEDQLYVFECSRIHSIESNLFVPTRERGLDDVYTYELCCAPKQRLTLNFLFVTGATITVQFDRLRFRRRILKRKGRSVQRWIKWTRLSV